jgi:hypothetical protein
LVKWLRGGVDRTISIEPTALPAPSCVLLYALCPHRYLLVYPHGCDVANHLSLFLCVADYDKAHRPRRQRV